MKTAIVHGDLLDQQVDVIVNSWNRNFIPWWLLLPQGVSGAIKRRGGTAPFRELSRVGILPLGGAVVTTAGKLPFKAIIHVAGLHGYWRASEKSIELSVRNSMALAISSGFGSIAYPVIGAGTGGMKVDRAIDIMIREIQPYESRIAVRIVVFEKFK